MHTRYAIWTNDTEDYDTDNWNMIAASVADLFVAQSIASSACSFPTMQAQIQPVMTLPDTVREPWQDMGKADFDKNYLLMFGQVIRRVDRLAVL